MRQRPTFLSAEPSVQALQETEQALVIVAGVLNQVEAERGSSPASQQLRERFARILPEWAALKARSGLLRDQLAEVVTQGDQAEADLAELFRDLNFLLTGDLYDPKPTELQSAQSLPPEKVEDIHDA